jgi:phospholipid transport system substrate-binding protein
VSFFLHLNAAGTTFALMSKRPFFTAIALCLTLGVATPALAQTADDFVQTNHHRLEALLRQAPSAQRDAQVASAFDQMVDYNELVRRCFRDHWDDLDAAKQTEVSGLLKQIIRKTYQRNLRRTFDYNVTYTGTRGQGSDVIVRTQAESKVDTRAAVLQVDYVVAGSGPFHVVDIVAENSSTVTTYYRKFHEYLTDPAKGYPFLVQKLKDSIARLNAQPS